MMLSALIIVTFLLACSQAATNITADVHAFITRFHELNDTSDVLDSLERIGEHSRELFTLGRPVGILLARFNLTLEADLDDVSAMESLHELFDDPTVSSCREKYLNESAEATVCSAPANFDVLAKCSPDLCQPPYFSDRFMIGSLSSTSLAKKFVKVRRVFDAMLMTLEDENRTEILRSINDHFSFYDPSEILFDLDMFINVDCSAMTRAQLSNYVQVLKAYRRLEERTEENNNTLLEATNNNDTADVHSDFWRAQKIDILALGMEATTEKLTEIVQKIDEAQPALNGLSIGDFYEVVEDRGTVRNMCHLKNVNVVAEFNQTIVRAELSKIHSDLMRLVLLQWAMSSVYDPEEYNRSTEDAVELLQNIGSTIASWMHNTREQSWPDMGIEAAKKAIGKGPILGHELKVVADKARRAFEEHGSDSYAYQVEVLPPGQILSELDGKRGEYAIIPNINGFDIHVLRYNRSDSEKEISIEKKLIKEKDGLRLKR